MSSWTHIAAIIDADTFMCMKDLLADVKEMLAAAPKITGSEGPAEVFVEVLSGHNTTISRDCENCRYKSTIKHLKEGFSCDSPSNFICPGGKYQTRVVISVIGDLRDRTEAQTKKEWEAFRDFVENEVAGNEGFLIRNQACNISI